MIWLAADHQAVELVHQTRADLRATGPDTFGCCRRTCRKSRSYPAFKSRFDRALQMIASCGREQKNFGFRRPPDRGRLRGPTRLRISSAPGRTARFARQNNVMSGRARRLFGQPAGLRGLARTVDPLECQEQTARASHRLQRGIDHVFQDDAAHGHHAAPGTRPVATSSAATRGRRISGKPSGWITSSASCWPLA